MRRRALLASIGTSTFVGCLGTRGTDRDPVYRRVSISDEIHVDGDLETEAAVLSDITSDSPGRIRLSLENHSDRDREFMFGVTPPFSKHWGSHESTDELLALVPEGHEEMNMVRVDLPDTSTPAEECWQLPEAMVSSDILQSVVIEAQEALTREYALWNAAWNEECLPTGTYVAESTLDWTVAITLDRPS